MASNLRTSFIAMAARNLLRNGWRSGLTAGGIAVSVAMMVWTVALMAGFSGTMVRGATAVELGQIQIHRADYADKAKMERTFSADTQLLQTIEAVAGVQAVSPRLRLWGLMGNEKRSQVGRLVGVDAVREAAVTPVATALTAGAWLSAKTPKNQVHEVVLGVALAKKLDVKIGSEVVAFLQAVDGSLGNDVFIVRGIVETGNQLIDRTTAFIHLKDAQYLGALDGQVHELAIRTARLDNVNAVTQQVVAALKKAKRLVADAPVKIDPDADLPTDAPTTDAQGLEAPIGLLVRPWSKLVPDLFKMIEMNDKSTGMLYFIIYLIAILSIVNTQRMSAWERRREFGVMLAIGLSPLRLFRLVLTETFLLALAGALLGAILGGAVAAWHATVGFDMAMMTDGGSFSYMGIAFNKRVFFEIDRSTILEPTLVMLCIGTLAGIWPAWKAMRLEPAATIAGRS